MTEDFQEVSWTVQLEEHFASTGEKAHCLAWCHKKSEEKYSRLRTWIDLPVIALSSICGFLQVGADTMFSDAKASSIGLGCLSLFTALLASTQTYFKWSARAEAHRISAIQWSRLYRLLNIEMTLPKEERKAPHDLLKDTKETYDRLQEISPLLPSDVIELFKKTFEKEKDISKPEEANGLEKITIYSENISHKIDGVASSPYTVREQNTRPTLQNAEVFITQTPSDIHVIG